jgi:hypothetical protein
VIRILVNRLLTNLSDRDPEASHVRRNLRSRGDGRLSDLIQPNGIAFATDLFPTELAVHPIANRPNARPRYTLPTPLRATSVQAMTVHLGDWDTKYHQTLVWVAILDCN